MTPYRNKAYSCRAERSLKTKSWSRSSRAAHSSAARVRFSVDNKRRAGGEKLRPDLILASQTVRSESGGGF